MGKTYRRKDLKVRDYDYFGKRILITILLNELLNANQTSVIVTAEENMNIKRMLFKQGLYTLNATPKGDTTKWSVNDWIKFIDENGNWEI